MYLRDSGLLHAFLNVGSMAALQAHPKFGASWEGFALEQVLDAAGTFQAHFWSTRQGAELDLLLERDGRRIGVEFKCADAPMMTKSIAILGFDGSRWILDPGATFVNAGQLAEAFVGQELLAYSQPHRSAALHYWHREDRSSIAEVDYVISSGDKVIPVEVKSGLMGRLKSLKLFLDTRKNVAPYGVRFSMHNFSSLPDLHSYPLYGVSSLASKHDETVRNAIRSLR